MLHAQWKQTEASVLFVTLKSTQNKKHSTHFGNNPITIFFPSFSLFYFNDQSTRRRMSDNQMARSVVTRWNTHKKQLHVQSEQNTFKKEIKQTTGLPFITDHLPGRGGQELSVRGEDRLTRPVSRIKSSMPVRERSPFIFQYSSSNSGKVSQNLNQLHYSETGIHEYS